MIHQGTWKELDHAGHGWQSGRVAYAFYGWVFQVPLRYRIERTWLQKPLPPGPEFFLLPLSPLLITPLWESQPPAPASLPAWLSHCRAYNPPAPVLTTTYFLKYPVDTDHRHFTLLHTAGTANP